MTTKEAAHKRVAIVALLVLSSALVTVSCDPGTGFKVVNERDEKLLVQVDGGREFTIAAGESDSLGVLLNSSLGTLVITGQDTGDTLFDQFLTWEQMTEMEFLLVID